MIEERSWCVNDDDEILMIGTWRLQTVVAAEVDEHTSFVVTLTFADGYRASVNLSGRGIGPLAVVLRDPVLFRELFVDPDAGTISWPNGDDLDPDRLRMLAMKQHPDDPNATPALRP